MRVKSIEYQIRRTGCCIGKPSVVITISKNGDDHHPEDVLDKIKTFKRCNTVIFCGIDPLIEQLEIFSIINQLEKHKIIISTTGGLMPDINIRGKVDNWEVNIPKDKLAVPFDYNLDALMFFSRQSNAVFYYTVKNTLDISKIEEAISFYNISYNNVVINYVSKDNLWLQKYCLEKGCSIQISIINKVPGEKDGNNRHNIRDTELSNQTSEDRRSDSRKV